MTRYRVLPYKKGSRSAKALATALGGKVLKLEGSTFKPKHGDLIINWGNSNGYISPPCPINCSGGCGICDPHVLNWCGLDLISNKWKFFEAFNNTGVLPEHWTNKEDIPNEAFPIVCRTILSGHSGAGIHIAHCRDDLVDCQLFVKYEKKKDEYRVHLGKLPDGGTTVISLQRKARRTDCENPNWQVRNHANGFVYVREGVNPPTCVLDNAKAVFEATGLDFGAVDVIWNETQERAWVLEINSAPGLEGQTVEDYASFFRLHS